MRLTRHRLASRRIGAHTRQADTALSAPFGHLPQVSGRKRDHRDRFALDRLHGLRGVPQCIAADDDRRAGDQRREPAFVRTIEIDRREMQHHVAIGDTVPLDDRLAMHRERAVLDRDALWRAGGTGRVDQVGKLPLVDNGRERRHSRGRLTRAGLVGCARRLERNYARGIEPRRRRNPRSDEPQRDPRIGRDVIEALARVSEIERDEGRARLQDGEQRDKQFGRALDAHPDRHFRPRTACGEPDGERVGRRIELGKAHPARAVDNGECAGARLRTLADQVVNRAQARRRESRRCGVCSMNGHVSPAQSRQESSDTLMTNGK